MNAVAEISWVSTIIFSPSVENEHANAGREGRTRLATPHSQAPTGTGEYHFPYSADLKQDRPPSPGDPHCTESADHT